jgi:hypothetical protein
MCSTPSGVEAGEKMSLHHNNENEFVAYLALRLKAGVDEGELHSRHSHRSLLDALNRRGRWTR